MKKYFVGQDLIPENGELMPCLFKESSDEYYSKTGSLCEFVGFISRKAKWVRKSNRFNEDEVFLSHKLRVEIPLTVGIETRTYWGDRVRILDITPDFHDCFKCVYLDDAELNHSMDCKKGNTYSYHPNNLYYTEHNVYKLKCSRCDTYH